MDDKRDLYNGFGSTFTRAFEMAGTTVIFAVLGHLLDRWLGITPVLTIVLAAFAVAGGFLRLYINYDAEMRRQEAGAPWARDRQ